MYSANNDDCVAFDTERSRPFECARERDDAKLCRQLNL